MSLLFRNYLEEGYYFENCMGDLTKIEDPDDIRDAQKVGKLYINDGIATTKVDENQDIL